LSRSALPWRPPPEALPCLEGAAQTRVHAVSRAKAFNGVRARSGQRRTDLCFAQIAVYAGGSSEACARTVAASAAWPRLCARRCVWAARKRARQPNHRILSDAVGLDVRDDQADELPLSDELGRGDQDDPARIVELREELARLTIEGERRPEPRPRRKPSKPRRYYTPVEVSTALELVAGGRSLREAAVAVGATHPTVQRWLRNAA
jgi:hypothetical protein